MTRNLLDETILVLKENGKTIEDIVWVGSKGGQYILPLSEIEIVLNIDYDSGYGAQEIASDLVIVGKDWWMERDEYDGSEWWSFKKIPILSNDPKIINKIGCGTWDTIEDMGGKL